MRGSLPPRPCHPETRPWCRLHQERRPVSARPRRYAGSGGGVRLARARGGRYAQETPLPRPSMSEPPQNCWTAEPSASPRVSVAAAAGPAWLAAVLDAVPDGIAVMDREHRVVFENRAMRERFNEAKRASAYLDGDARRDLGLECPADSALADGLPHHVIREIRLADGEQVYLELGATPLFDTESRLAGVLTVVRDETRRVRLE